MYNEKNSDDVFGKTFKRYSKKEMLEFIQPFKTRFRKNSLNLKLYVKDQNCVDLGCGNGRGTIYLIQNGAASVDCVDISKINLKKTLNVCKLFKSEKKIKKVHSTSHKIDIVSNSKNFVWCNGVLMHTHNPFQSLFEINRVLKLNGYSYIYVYGVGGLYWSLVEIFREQLKKTPPSKLINILYNLGYSNRYIGEYLDDWKVQYLRRYSKKDFEKSIKLAGFKIVKYMNRGLNYDTSEKKFLTKSKLFGDGDLRYILKKVKNVNYTRTKKILNLSKTSRYKESKEINKFKKLVANTLSKISNEKDKIKYCAKVQYRLRNEWNKKHFNKNNFFKYLLDINLNL